MDRRLNRLATFQGSGIVALGRFKYDVAPSQWSRSRQLVAWLITDRLFEIALAVMVLVSLVLGVIQTDCKAAGEEVPGWVVPVENILLLMYCIEMASRLYVLRLRLFEKFFGVMDFMIVLVDAIFFFVRLTSLELPNIAFLRVLRLSRLSRAFHILATQPQLSAMVESVLASMKSTLFGCLFIGMALTIAGIFGVEFLHPLALKVEFSSTCSRCPQAFSSVYASICTLIQTVLVQDEWGDTFLPFLDTHPETLLFVLPIFVIVNFGLMNLICAVIVESANQARLRNVRRLAEEKDQEFKSNQGRLRKICQEMDSDGSGNITLNELMTGYDDHLEFRRTLNAMDVKKEDLAAVFNILDEDSSGDVEYDEFVQQLYKMKSNDSHTMLVFIKHYVTELRKKMCEEIEIMQDQLVKGIARLHDRVGEELDLIKDNMDVNVKALQAADKRLEATVQKESNILLEEEKLLKDDMAMHSQAFSGMPPGSISSSAPSFAKTWVQTSEATTAISATAAEDLAMSSRFQSATERLAYALEDLKAKCENSAVLLNDFNSSLPRNVDATGPSLRSLANSAGTSHMAPQGEDSSLVGFWESKACCSRPRLAQAKSGGTHPLAGHALDPNSDPIRCVNHWSDIPLKA